jgi:hypothetical protein
MPEPEGDAMSRRTIRLIPLAAVLATAAVAVTAYAAGSPLLLGPAGKGSETTYQGFYDAHKDTYLITDVSDKAQASALHINYSKELAAVKGAPLQYFVKGRAASGQIAVFGSEPGESDYNPLWTEVFVTWKPSSTPVLLTSDNQIDKMAKAGKLTMKTTTIVLNAPITHVGK